MSDRWFASKRPQEVRRVAVVGAGTIGASWAAWFLSRGLDVVAQDPGDGAEKVCRGLIERAWPSLEALGIVQPGAMTSRLTFTKEVRSAVADVDFVQESAPERKQLKQSLYAEMESALRPDVPIASSTSGFPAAVLREGLRYPERLVIGHPFNPPHLIPLVEVVGADGAPPGSRAAALDGSSTSESAVDWTMAFYKHHGKHPVRLRKAIPGHVGNRLQAALWREAAYLISEGVASVEDVDAVVTEGIGLRWSVLGPTATFSLGGGPRGLEGFFAHLGPWMAGLWSELGAPHLDERVQSALLAGNRSPSSPEAVAQAEAARDQTLVELLRLRGR